MPFEVVMPRLGWNMETGALAEWRKRDGEYVEAGEILFAVESDKAIQEVEALESGILRIPADSPQPGLQVPVGTLLAYLVKSGESVPLKVGATPATAVTPSPPKAGASPEMVLVEQTSVAPSSNAKKPAISPRARRVADQLGVDWTRLGGSGRTGRIVERDVRQAAATSSIGRVSPLARRVAQEVGVDVEQLVARSPGKRIRRADVEAAARQAASVSPPPATLAIPAQAAPMPVGAVVPMTQVRRTIAERMAASAYTTAAVTLTTEANATELVRLRNQLKSNGAQPVPSFTDLLAKLVAQALTEHPRVNAHLESDAIVHSVAVHMGIAVDTERGLLVPVLRDVQAKSLRQISQESAILIERARSGQISLDELRGGTFTITNLGMYEIDAFTPIINLPECAILGLGRIVPKQVVVDADAGRVVIQHMMFLSLTFDHRVVDGAPAARFLQRVKQYVEKPYLWLAG